MMTKTAQIEMAIEPETLYNAVMAKTGDITVAMMCSAAIAAVRLVFGDEIADDQSYRQRCADWCAGAEVTMGELLDLEHVVLRLPEPYQSRLKPLVEAAIKSQA